MEQVAIHMLWKFVTGPHDIYEIEKSYGLIYVHNNGKKNQYDEQQQMTTTGTELPAPDC